MGCLYKLVVILWVRAARPAGVVPADFLASAWRPSILPWRQTQSRVVFVAALVLCAAANGAAQTVDDFNPGTNGEVRALAVQADGKILVGGTFTMLGGTIGTTARRRQASRGVSPDTTQTG